MYPRVLDYIVAGKEGGAKCVAGGDKLGGKGYYIKPTVFADVTDNMRIAREEVRVDVLCNIINFLIVILGRLPNGHSQDCS